jgi:hypothetical protein
MNCEQGVEVSCTVHDITTDDLLEAFPLTEITPRCFPTSLIMSGYAVILATPPLRASVFLFSVLAISVRKLVGIKLPY